MGSGEERPGVGAGDPQARGGRPRDCGDDRRRRAPDARPRRGGKREAADAFLELLPGTEEGRGLALVADAVRWAEEALRRAGIQGARLQATLLVGHALGLDRAQVLAALREPVPPDRTSIVRELIERRARREPLQYLRGFAHFLDFRVAVEPGVFIPRPETELVVETALRLWALPKPRPGWRRPATEFMDPRLAEPSRREGRWAVDVGTGSGAIALALARQRPEGRVLAIERAPKPARVARRNARSLGVAGRVRVVRGDLLGPLGAGHGAVPERLRRAVGIVVCNPPYAPVDSPDVHPEVRDHEPPEAWAGGPTGTEVYERLVPQAAEVLLSGRSLVLELGYGQEAEVPAILAADGRWHEPTITPDFEEIPRVLEVRRA